MTGNVILAVISLYSCVMLGYLIWVVREVWYSQATEEGRKKILIFGISSVMILFVGGVVLTILEDKVSVVGNMIDWLSKLVYGSSGTPPPTISPGGATITNEELQRILEANK